MATKTMKVGYRLVRNATSTAEKAPYLGVAVPVGSLAYDNILQRMLDRGTFMTRATAQYFLNAFYEYAAERIAEAYLRTLLCSCMITSHFIFLLLPITSGIISRAATRRMIHQIFFSTHSFR